MPTRSSLVLFAILSVTLGRPAAAQQVDSGGFVALLGTDTIAIERFVRSTTRLEGERVVRSPNTSVIHYVATLDRDGKVTRFEAQLHDGARLDGTPVWISVTDFGKEEVMTTFTGSEGTRTIRAPSAGVVVPLLTYSYALYEQAIRQARKAGHGQVPLSIMYPGQPELSQTWMRPAGRDSVAIATFHDTPAIVRIDHEGRLLSFDASATVIKVLATRVPTIDLPGLARQFAVADSAGRGMGQVSPRDTAWAVLNGVKIMVDYGRPAKRGRTIFGGLVPWDQVWRTGANAATQLIVPHDVMIGTLALRAGTYSLWTIPGAQGAQLVVNGESGQWGTDYHQGRDIARLPLTTTLLDQVVERFTVVLVPRAEGLDLHLSWDTTDWSIPIRLQ